MIMVIMFALSACTSYGTIKNSPGSGTTQADDYSIRSFQERFRVGENSVMLAFSGGGTRAAALSYGVLKALRDIPLDTADGQGRLLDAVDTISSVSGGSFTAAYYGLHGDGIFEDYEEVFLRKDVEGALIKRVLNPVHWFSSTGRTELAVEYYENQVFKGATFSDLKQKDGPMVVINASDLGYGVRFSFVQEYFNLLCSDISGFPVSRAVTASSAVPILFHPVVVENYSDCGSEPPEWLKTAREEYKDNPEMELVVDGLETYFDRDKRKYAHFVDGGITDNLGLRALYEVTELSGGMTAYMKKYDRKPPRRLVLIAVNASTDPEPDMDKTNVQPSLEETINAMSDIQLHRYNVATIELMNRTLKDWAAELSTSGRPVETYFILLDFKDVPDPKRRRFLNQTPTSFSLTDEQVDSLIETGGELLRNNSEFQRLLSDLGIKSS
jgi:NTE family protein